MTTRDELVMALAGRYAAGSRVERGRMLDEFAALTGHHRKHAMRLLRAGLERKQNLIPDPRGSPAIEPAQYRADRAIVQRQVAPGRSCPVHP